MVLQKRLTLQCFLHRTALGLDMFLLHLRLPSRIGFYSQGASSCLFLSRDGPSNDNLRSISTCSTHQKRSYIFCYIYSELLPPQDIQRKRVIQRITCDTRYPKEYRASESKFITKTLVDKVLVWQNIFFEALPPEYNDTFCFTVSWSCFYRPDVFFRGEADILQVE